MNLPEAQELGVLQARDHAQDARLLAELHVILKAHQVEAVGAQVFLAQLHHAYGRRPVRGSVSPIGFIGPKRSVSRPRRAISSIGRQASK